MIACSEPSQGKKLWPKGKSWHREIFPVSFADSITYERVFGKVGRKTVE